MQEGKSSSDGAKTERKRVDLPVVAVIALICALFFLFAWTPSNSTARSRRVSPISVVPSDNGGGLETKISEIESKSPKPSTPIPTVLREEGASSSTPPDQPVVSPRAGNSPLSSSSSGGVVGASDVVPPLYPHCEGLDGRDQGACTPSIGCFASRRGVRGRLDDGGGSNDGSGGESVKCFSAPEPITPVKMGLLAPWKEGTGQKEKKSYHKRLGHGGRYLPDLLKRFSIKSHQFNGSEKVEGPLECSWMPDESNLTAYAIRRGLVRIPPGDASSSSSSSSSSKTTLFSAFKYLTGTAFHKWYEWDAPLKEIAEDDEFRMTGTHHDLDSLTRDERDDAMGKDSKDAEANKDDAEEEKMRKKYRGYYHLRNFCIKPQGGFVGYQPKMEPFEGVLDYYPWWNGRALSLLQTIPPETRWAKDALEKNLEEMSEKPRWYVNRKLVILPVPTTKQNPWAAITYHGAASVATESVWPVKESSHYRRKKKDSDYFISPERPLPPDQESSSLPEEVSVPAREDVTLAYMTLGIGNDWFPPHVGGLKGKAFSNINNGHFTTTVATSHFQFNVKSDTVEGPRVFGSSGKGGVKKYSKDGRRISTRPGELEQYAVGSFLKGVGRRRSPGTDSSTADQQPKGGRRLHQQTERELSIFEELLKKYGNQPICFKEAIVVHGCRFPACYQTNRSQTVNGDLDLSKSSSIDVDAQSPLFGWRSHWSSQIISRRLRACVNAEEADRPRSPESDDTKIVVAWSVRSSPGTKTVENQNAVAYETFQLVKRMWRKRSNGDDEKSGSLASNGCFLAIEPSDWAQSDLLRIFTQVSVVIAPWSGLQIYLRVSPPQTSVMIELVTRGHSMKMTAKFARNRFKPGIDANPWLDYPAQAIGASQRYLAAILPKLKYSYHGKSLEVPLEYAKFVTSGREDDVSDKLKLALASELKNDGV